MKEHIYIYLRYDSVHGVNGTWWLSVFCLQYPSIYIYIYMPFTWYNFTFCFLSYLLLFLLYIICLSVPLTFATWYFYIRFFSSLIMNVYSCFWVRVSTYYSVWGCICHKIFLSPSSAGLKHLFLISKVALLQMTQIVPTLLKFRFLCLPSGDGWKQVWRFDHQL